MIKRWSHKESSSGKGRCLVLHLKPTILGTYSWTIIICVAYFGFWRKKLQDNFPNSGGGANQIELWHPALHSTLPFWWECSISLCSFKVQETRGQKMMMSGCRWESRWAPEHLVCVSGPFTGQSQVSSKAEKSNSIQNSSQRHLLPPEKCEEGIKELFCLGAHSLSRAYLEMLGVCFTSDGLERGSSISLFHFFSSFLLWGLCLMCCVRSK